MTPCPFQRTIVRTASTADTSLATASQTAAPNLSTNESGCDIHTHAHAQDILSNMFPGWSDNPFNKPTF